MSPIIPQVETTTATTTTTSAPTWATDVTEARDGALPDDHGVFYDRHVDGWTSTPVDERRPTRKLRVGIGAFVPDHRPGNPPAVDIYEDNVPELTLTAVDARRLGLALIQAADLPEGHEGGPRPALSAPVASIERNATTDERNL